MENGGGKSNGGKGTIKLPNNGGRGAKCPAGRVSPPTSTSSVMSSSGSRPSYSEAVKGARKSEIILRAPVVGDLRVFRSGSGGLVIVILGAEDDPQVESGSDRSQIARFRSARRTRGLQTGANRAEHRADRRTVIPLFGLPSRCLELGHFSRRCRGPDRSRCCYKCGVDSHQACLCRAGHLSCPLCADLGCPAGHMLKGAGYTTTPSLGKEEERPLQTWPSGAFAP